MTRNARFTSMVVAIAASFGATAMAEASEVLKSPSECELHRQISNEVPGECAALAAPVQGAVKYRSIVPSGAAPAPVALPVQQASTGPRSANMSINFDYNSAHLTAGAKSDLDRLVAVLNHGVNATSRFLVVGHTDAAGSDEYNTDLSTQRAAAVASYLGNRGVERSRVNSIGRGESELLDPANPVSAANRRVEIKNLGQ